jgi:hypothetical protein
MMTKIRLLTCLLSTLIVFTVQAQTSQDEAPEAPDIDTEALEIVKEMTDYLASSKVFAYRAETSYDVVQESGAKIEFGASRKVLVSRPGRMRLEAQRRDGTRSIVVFDGKELWVYAPDENVYAKAEQKGDLDDAIQFAVTELHLRAPLTDLVSPDMYEHMATRMTRALYLGETVVAGDTCEHLLISNDYADFQLWVTVGDKPVLRRIVITYREEPGEPQYRAHFLEWDMSPQNTAGQFSFEPPDNSERIRFYISAPATDLDQGGES